MERGEWQDLRWGDIATLEYGRALRGYDQGTGTVPVFGTNGPIGWHSEALCHHPGVVIGRKGAYRGVHFSSVPFFVIDTAFYLKAKSPFNMKWAYYALLTQDINGMDSGSAIPSTSRDAFYGLPMRLPPASEQQAIGQVLGTLDDKIELNRRMNETLEAMAQTVLRSWLWDRDGVRARADDLIAEGVLEIGDGYRAKNSEMGATGLPFLRAGNLANGFDLQGADLLREESVARAGNKVCRVGDVAFTSKGTIGRVARVGEHDGTFVYSPQVCYWRSLNHERLHPAVLYCWMRTNDFGQQVESVAGQTDMAPYVSLHDQRRMSVPRFPASHLAIAAKLQPLLTRRSLNGAASRTLAALRDALLPKLISGELRIRDAERVVGAQI